MTKEELEKEAEKFLGGWLIDPEIVKLLVDFAEPREKRIAELEKENAELKEENKKWKDEWQEQVQKANDEGYARTLQTIQLSKAKEIIKDLLSFVDSLGNYSGGIFARAEQFISEVEK